MTMQFRLGQGTYWLILLPLIFATMLIGALWSVTLYQLNVVRDSALAAATRDAGHFSRLLAVRTERAIDVVDQTVRLMKYAYDERGASMNLQTLVAGGVIRADVVKQFGVFDRDGGVMLPGRSSLFVGSGLSAADGQDAAGAPAEVDSADSADSADPANVMNVMKLPKLQPTAWRELVQFHAQHGGDGVRIEKPVAGAAQIQVTRRVSLADGSFNGVIVAAIDAAYFSPIVDAVDPGTQGVIALVGSDGVVRARRAAANDVVGNDAIDQAVVGKNVIDIPMLKAMELQEEGTLRTASAVDGIERVWAYRRLEGQPLYVVVGLGVDDSLQSFKQTRRDAIALAAGATLLSVVFCSLLTLLMRRLCLSRELAMAESRNKSALLSNMSHELRTSLHGILGYAELLRDELVELEKRSFAQYIHDSGSHLLALVNSLLQISKIEAGQVSIDVKSENLAVLLGVAINTHASSAAVKGLTLSLTMAPDLPAELACDRMRVMQVLNNLLHNAIKFTTSGKVELAVVDTSEGVRFSVSDTGPGITPDLQGAVFGSFFQVDRHAADGTGLGLAISKQVVELMNGTIGVESTQGHGATFFFTLPLKALA